MRIDVTMKNPKTGELSSVKVGFSWTVFFFAGLFGLPLFMRKLYIWGTIVAVLYICGFLILPLVIPGLIVQIYLAIKGNELTAKNYLEQGWEFAEIDENKLRSAKAAWGLALLDAPAKA